VESKQVLEKKERILGNKTGSGEEGEYWEIIEQGKKIWEEIRGKGKMHIRREQGCAY
jgi:hypothetical protein